MDDTVIFNILSVCKKLHSVELDGTRITTASVKKITEELPHLKKLIIAPKFCQDSTIDLIAKPYLEELGWITMTDETMMTLGANSSRLRKVYLSGAENACHPDSVELFQEVPVYRKHQHVQD